MENLVKIMNNALIERYKQQAIINMSSKEIQEICNSFILKKYRNRILYRDNLEFELYDVKTILSTWRENAGIDDVIIELVYFCTSKLPKIKRDKIKEAKDIWDRKKYVNYHNYKIPIWHLISYDIPLEILINKRLNLEIK